MKMDYNNIESVLLDGTDVSLRSRAFSITQLRGLAKAALRGNSKLTLVVGNDLSPTDIKEITGEAQRNVVVDLMVQR